MAGIPNNLGPIDRHTPYNGPERRRGPVPNNTQFRRAMDVAMGRAAGAIPVLELPSEKTLDDSDVCHEKKMAGRIKTKLESMNGEVPAESKEILIEQIERVEATRDEAFRGRADIYDRLADINTCLAWISESLENLAQYHNGIRYNPEQFAEAIKQENNHIASIKIALCQEIEKFKLMMDRLAPQDAQDVTAVKASPAVKPKQSRQERIEEIAGRYFRAEVQAKQEFLKKLRIVQEYCTRNIVPGFQNVLARLEGREPGAGGSNVDSRIVAGGVGMIDALHDFILKGYQVIDCEFTIYKKEFGKMTPVTDIDVTLRDPATGNIILVEVKNNSTGDFSSILEQGFGRHRPNGCILDVLCHPDSERYIFPEHITRTRKIIWAVKNPDKYGARGIIGTNKPVTIRDILQNMMAYPEHGPNLELSRGVILSPAALHRIALEWMDKFRGREWILDIELEIKDLGRKVA